MMRKTFALLLTVAALAPLTARADLQQGIDWLVARDSATGVHRDSDVVAASDANTEAWLSAEAIGFTSRFNTLADAAAADGDDSLIGQARRAIVLLQQGRSADAVLDAALRLQRRDGGFPTHAGGSSDALATGWMLRALDRAGRGGQTPAQRALAWLGGAQRSDGGWATVPGGASSPWASAQAAIALQGYATRFNLSAALGRARNYLLSTRSADGSFADLHAGALVIEALVLLGNPRDALATSVAWLGAQQQADGSFAGDAYLTALALRALHADAQPFVDPALAGLRGRVISADSELPITGATLSLSGAATLTLTSNNRGELVADNLVGGSYQATLSYPGMQPVSFEFTVPGGRIVDLGTLRMFLGRGPVNLFGVVRGRVVDADTGAPVAGARLRLDNPANEVTSDADGRFQFLQLPPGPIRIDASASGFCDASMVTTAEAGVVVEATFRLSPRAASGTTAEVRGVVLHGETGAPLAGVAISASVGGPVPTASTAADGSYTLSLDADGVVELRASAAGFDSVALSTRLVPNQVFTFSPRLYPAGQTPPGANRASVRGVVVNQANRQPLANALIVITDPAGQQTLRSADDGSFEASSLTGPEVGIAISADAFDAARLRVPIGPLEQRDVGVIGLKPTALDFYFPDLAIVDSTLATTEPDLFSLSQGFEVEIANRGTANIVQDFDLVAFVDSDGDGVFDEGLESEVGRARIDQDLTIGGSTTAAIAVTAQLAFRDAPIAFLVDAANEVPEQDEDNNTGSSLLGCRVTPAFIGNDSIEEVWRWRGLASNPNINSLNQVPVVGQLSDDNGDGAINAYDIPDLVFVAAGRGQYGPASTALVAISGTDGRELWSRTDVNLSHFSSLALGDIDNDAIAEIVGVRGYREELIAFEHTGQLKWRVPLSGPSVPEVIFPPPPYVYDMITIANLEGDNEAEVIHGRQAFRGISGEQLWEGAHDAGGDGGLPAGQQVREAFGIGAIVADIDMNGVMEVVAGRSAYDADGRTLWHRADIKPDAYEDADGTPMNQSGLNAVGNFDLDDFPEIVLSIGDELYLLEHTGETIWGPKYAPDFGEMGAPSLADLDRDGLPEIMISSNRRLTVFESDGTVKWTTDIKDDSGVTSATVFDFENDGLYEVIHMDEEDFRIFDALTGARLYETRNTSVTVYEYPVVADIDGDKQAEIILTGFDRDLLAGTTPGIRVFKARNGAWADAGSVWGSNSFHINEVNEDSTVPLLETPSWLTHNTYRVQRSPFPDPLGMPDFSVGELRLIDQGPALRPRVQVRVGNAGPVDAHEPPWIGVYRGDPASGGVLLAETRLDTLRAARFQVVDLGEVALTGSGDLYAVVDQRGRARECREGNNQRNVEFSASNGRGVLQLSTDQASYEPGETVAILPRVENRGGIAADFRVELEIRNAQNQIIARFDPLHAAAVTPAAPRALAASWFSGDALAGSYRVEARLLDGDGQLVSTATAAFALGNTGSGASLRLTTDKARYRPGETVLLSVQAENLSAAEVLRAPQLTLELDGPGGVLMQRTLALEDLFAGARYETELSLDAASAGGNYSVRGSLRSLLQAGELANDRATFARADEASAALSGTVDAQLAELAAGQTQNCLMTVRNTGNAAVSGLPARRRVIAEASEQVMLEVPAILNLGANASEAANQSVTTGGFTDGLYACVLEVQQGGGWRVLDAEAFRVLGGNPPGIVVTPTRGLVTSEEGQRASFTVVLASAPNASVRVPLQVSDAAEWRLAVESLSFSPATWNIPRTVEVEGLDDVLSDGDQLGLIRLLAAESTDAAYAGMDGADVEISNLDNDGAQVLVSPTSLQTGENGAEASFSVRLSSAPASPVSIPLELSDSSEWALSEDSVSFDASDWNQPYTVTVRGLDDDLLDGTQNGTLRLLPALSGDPAFHGKDPVDIRLSNLDDERPSVLVEPQSVATRENGQPGSVVLRLSAAPSAPVRIAVGAVDASEWQVPALEVVLSANNWQGGVPLLVLPVDDEDIDGTQTASLVLGPARSADGAFDGLAVPAVALSNADDEGERILVEPLAVVVGENAGTASFAVRLSAAPSAEVVIPLASTAPADFTLGSTELRFAAGDAGPQTVTVTGIDNAAADGNRVARASLGVASSADARYQGQDADDVSVTVLDDERIDVLVQPDGALVTSEAGDTAVIEVRLSAAPTAEVRLALATPDASEWQLDAAMLRFDPGNWQQPQRATVRGVDDAEVDGDVQSLLVLPPLSSDDPRFDGLDPRDLLVLNRDDDTGAPAALVVEAIDLETSEAGDRGSLRVALSRAPAAAVRIQLSSGDAAELQVQPAELRFEVDNATMPQTVTLIGLDDDAVDGVQEVELEIAVLAGSDPAFAALPAQRLRVRNLDNDLPRIHLELRGAARIVEGQSTALEAWLGSPPSSEVLIDLQAELTRGHTSEAAFRVEPAQLRIGPADWQQRRSLRLLTVDDSEFHGGYEVAVDSAPASSADSVYAGLRAAPVLVQVGDNEQPPIFVPVDRPGWLLFAATALLLGGLSQLRRRRRAHTD